MSFFACALQMDAEHVSPSFRTQIENARFCRDRQLAWYPALGFLAVVDLDGGGIQPVVARVGQAIAVGVIRLDNRAELARRMDCEVRGMGDLELAMRFLLRDSGARVDEMLGDFAFVVWDPSTRRLMAVRDTFGVRTLYHAGPRNGLMAFCSRAEPLASGDQYDVKYLVDRIAYCRSDPERTVYSGVRAVPPASLLHLRHGAHALTTYWSATDAQTTSRPLGSTEDQVVEFRSLLIEAVRLRLGDGPHTWSHLSGGLDSSSVVSVAQWLEHSGSVQHGLGGTVTYTDPLGTGADEREYSDAVVGAYQVRNELVPHRVSRLDALFDPPTLDQPNRPYPAAARDRAAARIVTQADGQVLLTGIGGDNLLLGTMFFFADWLVTGQLRMAIREMAHRAAIGRVSFWKLASANAVLPLIPEPLRRVLMLYRPHAAPYWLTSRIARDFDVGARTSESQFYRGRYSHKYSDALATTVAAIPSTTRLGPLEDMLDVRHPYLHRPLVDFALGLSPEMCVRAHERKWMLRESMRGILPEFVRTRVGKGNSEGLDVWSLSNEQRHLTRLLRNPILAQLGCIDPLRLRTTIDGIIQGRENPEFLQSKVSRTFEVEMWLQLRAGRWTADGMQSEPNETRNVA